MEMVVKEGLRMTIGRWRPGTFAKLDDSFISALGGWLTSFRHATAQTSTPFAGKTEHIMTSICGSKRQALPPAVVAGHSIRSACYRKS